MVLRYFFFNSLRGRRAHISPGVCTARYEIWSAKWLVRFGPGGGGGGDDMRDTAMYKRVYAAFAVERRRARRWWPTGTPSIFCLVGAQKGPLAGGPAEWGEDRPTGDGNPVSACVYDTRTVSLGLFIRYHVAVTIVRTTTLEIITIIIIICYTTTTTIIILYYT